MTNTPTIEEIEKAAKIFFSNPVLITKGVGKDYPQIYPAIKECCEASFLQGAKSLLPIIQERDAEIERLKGLVETAYDRGFADYDDVIMKVRNGWQQFKLTNNL